MISKKEVLVLGLLAIGGMGVASMVADNGGGGGGERAYGVTRVGGILGSTPSQGAGGITNIYNITQPDVAFPTPQTFDISGMFKYPETPVPTVSGGKKISTGGETSSGWMYRQTAKETGYKPAGYTEVRKGVFEPEKVSAKKVSAKSEATASAIMGTLK